MLARAHAFVLCVCFVSSNSFATRVRLLHILPAACCLSLSPSAVVVFVHVCTFVRERIEKTEKELVDKQKHHRDEIQKIQETAKQVQQAAVAKQTQAQQLVEGQ
jgi:hypothetical protein